MGKKNQFTSFDGAMDSIPLNSTHKLIIFLVALGALFDGIEQYVTGYAAPNLVSLWGITDAQIGLLSTFTFGGMAIGSLIAGIAGDIWGRKVTFMYNLGLYTFGALIAAFAPNLIVLYIGRLIAGIGLGGELNTGLTIVSESVPTKNRGSSTAVVNVAAGGLGIFLSAGLSYVVLGPLANFFGGDDLAWRWLFGLLALPALLLWVYRFYLPESPRFLVTRGRIDEANTVLTMLKKNTIQKKKIKTEEILVSDAKIAKKEKVNFKEIFSPQLKKRTIGIWIIAWMTFGAQVGITIFLPTVLISKGFTIVNSLLYTTVINTGGLIGAIITVYFASKIDRKKVLGWGAFVAIIVSVLFGLANTTTSIIILGGLMQFMFMVLNTTTWLFAPEIYPTRIRSFGTGATVVLSLTSGAVMPYIFGNVFSLWDSLGLYAVVAAMYLIMAIATFTLTTETRGKSLEDISA